MKHYKLSLALVLAWVLGAGLALAQDDLMTLNSKDLGPHQRPLVVFSHAKHSANIECITCHHDFDKYFNLKSSEGQLCSDCHKAAADASNKVALADGFHKQCQDCHHKAAGKGNLGAPVMCGDCHVEPGRLAAASPQAQSPPAPSAK